MRTLTAQSSYGNHGQYVARITGRDSKFTFSREFLGRKTGKRNETTEADVDESGLYETCDVGKRGKESTYYVILDCPRLPRPGGSETSLRQKVVEKSEAMQIAKALDAGRAIEEIVEIFMGEAGPDGKRPYEYRLLSEAEARKQQAAATVETAIEACWAALQSLPEREAKKVLAAVKLRVSPPKPTADPAAAEASAPAEQPTV